MDDNFTEWLPIIRLAISNHAVPLNNDREDLEQEALLALVESQDKLTSPDTKNKAGLVYQIAKNAVIDYRRRKSERNARNTWHLQEQENVPDPEQPPDSSSIDLDQALAALPDSQQRVIRAIYFEGLSESDVGAELGLTRWAVRKIKDEALKNMKGRLTN